MTGYLLKMFPRFSETFILSELLELERRGRAIHVVSLKKPDDGRFHAAVSGVRAPVTYLPEHVSCAPRAFAAAHLRAAAIRPRPYFDAFVKALRFRGDAWKAFCRAPLVAEAFRSAACQRIHAHFASLPAITAMFAADLCDLPFSFTAHAKDIFLHLRSESLLRLLIRKARRVITVSDFNLEYLRRLGGIRVPRERIVRVYNGVDLRRFNPRRDEMPDGDPPLVLAVGRLVEKKGFGDLIEACAALRGWGVVFRCQIVGKGPLHDELAASIRRYGLESHASLTGPLPGEEIARRLSHAALLAAPCIVGRDGNRDGLPTVILEAMASGIPVISTAVTGIPEAVVDLVTGHMVTPGDVPAFASRLASLLGDPSRRELMGRAARARAERLFDLQNNVETLDHCIHGTDLEHPKAGPVVPSPGQTGPQEARA